MQKWKMKNVKNFKKVIKYENETCKFLVVREQRSEEISHEVWDLWSIQKIPMNEKKSY